jgi:drug/metabolite transporter (DMT)-like permease
MSLEAVFAVLFGGLILRDTLLPVKGAGCIMILDAVVLGQLKNGKMRAT